MILIARLLLALLLAMTLAACGHARVVRMEGQPPRSATTRPTVRPTPPLPRAAPQAVPTNGYHIVQAGETLYGISFRFGLRYQDVAEWNQLDDVTVIHVGQRLSLRAPSAVTGASPRVASPITAPAAVVAAPTVPVVAPATPTITPAARPVTAIATGAPAWRWPTSGQIIGRFVAGDQTQQGIDIAGSAGQPVIAAADGVVVYSGAGLVGYGELIIIKHNDQWLSAYAHNRRRLVAEGAQIKAGDVVAEMGRSGAIRDMLHFEIRLNGKPVDPLQYLPAK
jgi:lipoprotein NlpD